MAKKNDKRAIEEDSSCQVGILLALQEKERLEVLRIEVRLNKPKKIRQLFRALDLSFDLTFQELFSSTISQKILQHYFDEIERQRPVIMDYKASDSEALLADLIINNPEMSPVQILKILGLKQALDSIGPRTLRAMFSKSSPRTWYRLMADAKKVKLAKQRNPFGAIREHLVRFVPLRLVNF